MDKDGGNKQGKRGKIKFGEVFFIVNTKKKGGGDKKDFLLYFLYQILCLRNFLIFIRLIIYSIDKKSLLDITF